MTSKARGLADLGNVYDDGALGSRNAIINGEFSVSQRGDFTSPSTFSDNQYTLDRWRTYRGTGTATIQDKGYSVELVATSSYTGTLSLRQLVEWSTLASRVGQKFTLSAYVKTTSSNARLLTYDGSSWATGATPHSGSGQWERLTFTFTMPDASSYNKLLTAVGIDGIDSANVSIANGETVEIKQVQLEVGDTATPFEHEPYGVTLQKCQRYYEVLPYPVSQYIAVGFAYTGTSGRFNLTYQHKRATPSISFAGNIKIYYDGNNNDDCTLLAEAVGVVSTRVNYTLASVTTQPVGNAVGALADGAPFYVNVDAEL
jgi:hypothetical protein